MIHSNKERPLVTIGVASYNNASYIEETLNSIHTQTYKNIELIIIDDCSTDNSVEIIRKWMAKNEIDSILIARPQNKGIIAFANDILAMAKGKYYQLIGSDDRLMEKKIEIQVNILENTSKNVAMVYSNVYRINEYGELYDVDYLRNQGYDPLHMPEGNVFNELLKFCFIPAVSVLLKTDHVKQIGGYNKKYLFEDYDLWLRLSLKYKIIYSQYISAEYRIHTGSIMGNPLMRINLLENRIECLYSYFNKDLSANKNIINSINSNISVLYNVDHPKTQYWLKKSLSLKFNIKMFFLLILNSTGISYQILNKLIPVSIIWRKLKK